MAPAGRAKGIPPIRPTAKTLSSPKWKMANPAINTITRHTQHPTNTPNKLATRRDGKDFLNTSQTKAMEGTALITNKTRNSPGAAAEKRPSKYPALARLCPSLSSTTAAIVKYSTALTSANRIATIRCGQEILCGKSIGGRSLCEAPTIGADSAIHHPQSISVNQPTLRSCGLPVTSR